MILQRIKRCLGNGWMDVSHLNPVTVFPSIHFTVCLSTNKPKENSFLNGTVLKVMLSLSCCCCINKLSLLPAGKWLTWTFSVVICPHWTVTINTWFTTTGCVAVLLFWCRLFVENHPVYTWRRRQVLTMLKPTLHIRAERCGDTFLAVFNNFKSRFSSVFCVACREASSHDLPSKAWLLHKEDRTNLWNRWPSVSQAHCITSILNYSL